MDSISIHLPASKSISNRVLILNALTNWKLNLINLSEAQDTKDLYVCLQSDKEILDIGEGATSLRFLLAFLCYENQVKTIFCGPSLKIRPIQTLLRVLNEFHCEFEYLEENGKLPVKIVQGIHGNYPEEIQIDTSISSQFVSAMLLIAPYLKSGLKIQFTNQMVSKPYIDMTLKLMQHFGVQFIKNLSSIQVFSGKYQMLEYRIESDWSSASFFYAWLALQDSGSMYFPGLKMSGMQGDEVVASFFLNFGIESIIEADGIHIIKNESVLPEAIDFDFTNCPDLFPPICMFCAIRKIISTFRGLQHLVHKESNRLKILNDFLSVQSVEIELYENDSKQLTGFYRMDLFNSNIEKVYSSHMDHRIAMAFSLLNVIRKIEIVNPEVVNKSFPGYWEAFNKVCK
ncbi:MAG: hypothetical protein IPO16_11525 [Saprospiraceae bacterium]|nr:hypothetical protein [Saprospiraceae bacterium]